MKKVSHRRPSASMVVAITALVVALGGTAVAASHLSKGDNLIKKRSLSGNRLKNHTITGTQVNLSKLGKVPTAAKADTATSATSATSANTATSATSAGTAVLATSATNAISATNATNAANLVGLSRFNKSIAPAGTTLATAATTVVAADGPLTVYGACWVAAGHNHAVIGVSSTSAGFYNDTNVATAALPANTPESVSVVAADAAPNTPSFQGPYSPFALITANGGNYIQGEASVAVNLTSANQCTFLGVTSAF